MQNLVPEGYKKTKVGVIPNDWEVVKLGEIFQKSFYGTSNSTNEIGKYPVLRMGNMKNGTLDLKDLVYINLEEKEFKKYQLKKGDILLNRTNSYELVGKISLFDLEGDYISASYIVVYRPNFKVLNSIFINNLLNTTYFQEKIRTIATKGVSQANINPTSFKEVIKIPLPPIKEQEKIAEILTTWDEAITKQEELIKETEQLKKGLMKNLLSGKVRFNGFSDDWEEVRLYQITEKMQSGGTPKADNKEYYNGNIPFVKVNDITSSGKYLIGTQSYITENGLKNSPAWIVPINSIIYSMYASVGFLSINKIEVATSQAMINIILDLKKANLEYIYYYLLDFQKNIHIYIETGTQGNLNAQIVKNLKIKLPSIQEQEKIAEVLSLADEKINLLKNELEELKLQKKSLMQKLLTGQVRVKV